jgi:glutamate-1-semialdehyde 2,1-aminomutase
VIGGGMPVGAFGGRREIMARIAPLGPVYQAGTLSGNPVAVAAGLATLRLLQAGGFHELLAQRTRQLTDGLAAAAQQTRGGVLGAQAIGGMFGLYFRSACPQSYAEVMDPCDKDAFNRFFHAMLDAGHYFAPSAFEAGFSFQQRTARPISPPPLAPPKRFSRPGNPGSATVTPRQESVSPAICCA